MFVTNNSTRDKGTNAPETDTRYDIKTYESYDIDVVRRTSPAICRDRAPARPVASIHRRCAAREKRVRAPGDHAPPDRTAPRTRHPAGRTVSPQAARPRPIRAARACHECRESTELARSATAGGQLAKAGHRGAGRHIFIAQRTTERRATHRGTVKKKKPWRRHRGPNNAAHGHRTTPRAQARTRRRATTTGPDAPTRTPDRSMHVKPVVTHSISWPHAPYISGSNGMSLCKHSAAEPAAAHPPLEVSCQAQLQKHASSLVVSPSVSPKLTPGLPVVLIRVRPVYPRLLLDRGAMSQDTSDVQTEDRDRRGGCLAGEGLNERRP